MVLLHGRVDGTMMDQEQLDRIEEKLDKLIELLEQPRITITGEYPEAPHEQAIDFNIYPYAYPSVYPWRPHETFSSP